MANTHHISTAPPAPSSLSEMLSEYSKADIARFHMPGHKGGLGLAGFNGHIAKWDISEIPGADDLHSPSGVIARAQEAAAHAFGAKHTFFLVNGATAGITAALLCLGEGSRVIAARDCHRSVISGAALAGLELETAGSPDGVITADEIDAALRRAHARAVVITSPNYYGLCPDVAAIYALTRGHGALLIVDSAHGAHFPFSKLLPPSPSGQADIWVQSAHKTLSALGQGAYLHMGECEISPRDMRRALAMVETSSPSYPIMASLDWARHQAQAQRTLWAGLIARLDALRARIAAIEGLSAPCNELIGHSGVAHVDPTRLVINVFGRGISGYSAQESLRANGVQVELADEQSIVCITTPVDPPAWFERLLKALEQLPQGKSKPALPAEHNFSPERVLSVRDAVLRPVDYVSPQDAAGRICAAAVGPYPPGVPWILPGERISAAVMDTLLLRRTRGAELFGLQDGLLACTKT